MAWTEQDYQEIVARLKTESQGVGDVPNAETLTGISSLPAYQEKDGEDIIVRAPLELLAAPALDAADKANAAATKAEENATAAQTAANSANEKAGLAAQAASDANAAKEGAEAATQSANNAASNAEEKATAANTAAQDAEKVANNPTYIGKDHYVYVYNKDTESFDKTDIYCKGEPGSSFRVAGEYDTLEALKSAVPDGSAVDGFMAVGTEAPYDYYAWVNGEWVSQGKIAGGNVIVLPREILDLTGSSSSEEIFATFGGIDKYKDLLEKLSANNYLVQIGEPSLGSLRHIYTLVEYSVKFASNKQSGALSLNIYNEDRQLRRLHFYLEDNGTTARCGEASTFQLVKDSDVLTKTNTSPFTPTGDYQPATKEYVDNIGYGKVIDVDGNDSINNINAQGTEAENRINRLFGSINSFKNVVIDIVNSHAKYHFHLFNLTSNCIEMGSVFAYVSSSENNRYLLSFIFTYLDYCRHCKIDVTDVSKEVIIKDLVASDNLTTLTKKTAAEYDAIGSKDANTAYCVTD